MRVAGIIAEYNPFHTGHAHQLARTRAALGEETAVAVVMSGNWVQSGRPAVADKWLRARLALGGGADLVLELPTVWAASSAEAFARGAVALLHASGVVTDLSFGSERGELAALEAVAQCLDSAVYAAGLRRFLDEGMSFPACRQAVVRGLLGAEAASVLDRPNNSLGVEYLRALRALGSGIRPLTVLREGAGHGSLSAAGERPAFRSATELRRLLLAGQWDQAAPYLPGDAALLRDALASPEALRGCERALLARLRTMDAGDWAALPDSGAAEGLPDRLVRAGRAAGSLEAFLDLAKTKRYTRARLRRLALWAFLGLREADRPAAPCYLRVLGCNRRGRALLREMKARAALPLLTKSAHARRLDEAGRRLFALESRCTDLYGLCFDPVRPGGREWTTGPVVN